MEENKIGDILKVEGINSKGYGIIPKAVMQDRRLQITSKAIYSYFKSYAGSGSTAFPTVDKICFDLCITEETFRKYLKPLKELDLIRVEQVREKGKFKNNIYTLIDRPDPENAEEIPTPKIPGTVKSGKTKSGTVNPRMAKPNTTNPDTIISSMTDLGNNNISNKIISFNNISQSVTEGQTELEQIIDQCQFDYFEEDIKNTFEGIIEMMYFAPEIKVQGSVIPQSIIRKNLKRINPGIIEHVLDNLRRNNTKIVNNTSYIGAALYNSLHEVNAEAITFDTRKGI